MKKTIWAIVMAALLMSVVPAFLPAQAFAQQKTYLRKVVDSNGRVRYVRVNKPSFYRRHRNRVNLAVGTGGGALIGGLLGGKKGALIGGATGLGASALYTYVWNKKKRKYVKVRRN